MWTMAKIKDTLVRIEAKVDQLIANQEAKTQVTIEEPEAPKMTAAERMAHARSFRKDVNTGEGGRG